MSNKSNQVCSNVDIESTLTGFKMTGGEHISLSSTLELTNANITFTGTMSNLTGTNLTKWEILGTEYDIDAGGDATALVLNNNQLTAIDQTNTFIFSRPGDTANLSRVKALSFSGDGALLQNLNANNITTGTVNNARLSSDAQGAISKQHYQNTDTGTAFDTFTIGTADPEEPKKLGFGYQHAITLDPLNDTFTIGGDVVAQGFQGDGSLLTNLPITTGPQGDIGFQGAIGAQGPQGNVGSTGPQGAQGLKGDTGNTGAQGAMGPQGRQGFQGVAGTNGNQGAQGLKGDTGNTGAQGLMGYQGVQGLIGAQGPQGFQGLKGDIGNTGAQGPQGRQGFQGITGTNGAQGSQGFMGPQGNVGSTGSTGSQGPQGLKGDTGNTGAQGAMGPQGRQGIQGPQGRQGFQGISGPQGLTGSTGSQGVQGPQAPGTHTQNTDTGTSSDDFLIGIGSGDKHKSVSFYSNIDDHGELLFIMDDMKFKLNYMLEAPAFVGDGSQLTNLPITTGPQGDIGFQGAIGAQGPQGFQGISGPQGPQGRQGFQGISGPQGRQGFQGIQGISGPQGPQGRQGFQGIQGPQATGIQRELEYNDSAGAPIPTIKMQADDAGWVQYDPNGIAFHMMINGWEAAMVYAEGFSGGGNGLYDLNASNLSSGTVPDVRLSSNVARRNQGNTFEQMQATRRGQVMFGDIYVPYTEIGFGTYTVKRTDYTIAVSMSGATADCIIQLGDGTALPPLQQVNIDSEWRASSRTLRVVCLNNHGTYKVRVRTTSPHTIFYNGGNVTEIEITPSAGRSVELQAYWGAGNYICIGGIQG